MRTRTGKISALRPLALYGSHCDNGRGLLPALLRSATLPQRTLGEGQGDQCGGWRRLGSASGSPLPSGGGGGAHI